jgi:hypothetical protein
MTFLTLKRVCTNLIKSERAAFSLIWNQLLILFFILIFCTFMWFSSGYLGHKALVSAVESAGFAGQSQVLQQVSSTNSGYTSTQWSITQSSANTAAQTLWQQEIQNMILNQAFENLNCTVSLQGTRVIITVIGDYKPLFLRGLISSFPYLSTIADVPESTTVEYSYPVTNQ